MRAATEPGETAALHPVDARRRKALARLAADGALLAPRRDGRGYGVFANGDRRCRPLVQLGPADVQALLVEGAIVGAGMAQCFVLSGAGRARVQRESADAAPFAQQHAPYGARPVMDAATGALRFATGVDPSGPVGRLARISDAAGMAFFQGREIAAARQLWEDHAAAQLGLFRGADWTAPPRGSARRGPGGAQEQAATGAIDARRRVSAALEALPASLAAALRAFLLEETGLDDLERARRWPQRSGKLVLKLGLELLADHYGRP